MNIARSEKRHQATLQRFDNVYFYNAQECALSCTEVPDQAEITPANSRQIPMCSMHDLSGALQDFVDHSYSISHQEV